MIVLGCFVLMLAVAYASMREGVVLAFTNLVNVALSILITFNLWTYLATELETEFRNGALDALEDVLPLGIVFAASVVGLRYLTVKVFKDAEFGFSDLIDKGGGFVVGLVTGYLTGGFLILVLQTIPWHENFLDFKPEKNGIASRPMPGDQFVLRFLHKAMVGSFAAKTHLPGDRGDVFETFEKDFAMCKRCTDTREPMLYNALYPPPPEPKVDEPTVKDTLPPKDPTAVDPNKKDDGKSEPEKKAEEPKDGEGNKGKKPDDPDK